MKRIALVSTFALIVSLVCFYIVKFWGQSQVYPEYRHPLFAAQVTPIEFVKPSFADLDATLKGAQNLYLDLASTADQKVVLTKRAWSKEETALHNLKYEDVKNDVVLLTDYKDFLKNRKIIFNLNENAQAGHEIFFHAIQEVGLEKGENFIVTSPYEAMMKALKENHPALVFGTTTPEILKILAMSSMHLIVAANIRADVIVHPLEIRGQTFYTEDLLNEFKRRNKRIIVGPITAAEKEKAVSLNPYGLIILN